MISQQEGGKKIRVFCKLLLLGDKLQLKTLSTSHLPSDFFTRQRKLKLLQPLKDAELKQTNQKSQIMNIYKDILLLLCFFFN